MGKKQINKRRILTIEEHIDRIFARSKADEDTRCINWLGPISKSGYPICNFRQRPFKGMRLVWFLLFGELSSEVYVCHSCDNRRCINPDHLWLGTNADNTRDAFIKQRHAFGSRNGRSKLKDNQVRDVRELLKRGVAQKIIAIKFGLDPSTISYISRNKTWKYLN